MEQTRATDIVLGILKSKFQISDTLLTEKNFDEPFTGPLFSMDDITLTYLFLEINKFLDNSLCADKLNNYQFNSISGVAKAVENSLNIVLN